MTIAGPAVRVRVERTLQVGAIPSAVSSTQSLTTIDARSVIRLYDRYAPIYDFVYGRFLQHGRKTFAQTFAGRPGDMILEIGVGSGLMLPLYPRHVGVLGLDISPRMLQKARALIKRKRLSNVELRLVEADLPYLPASRFDHVVLPYVYSVTPDPSGLIDKAFKACKPGGSIWILNHFSGLGGWRYLERAFKPFARSIGFRSDFPYEKYVANQDWNVVAEYKVNPFSLSRLIHVRKDARTR